MLRQVRFRLKKGMPAVRAGLLELKRVSKLQSVQTDSVKAVSVVNLPASAYFNSHYYPEHQDFLEYIRIIVNWGEATDPQSVANLNSWLWKDVAAKKYLKGIIQEKLVASLGFIKQRSEADKPQKLAVAFMVADYLAKRVPKLIENVNDVMSHYEEEVNKYLDANVLDGTSQDAVT